jgi:hypothetical protein
MAWIPLFLILLQGTSLALTRTKNINLEINNCRGAKLKFQNSWTITLDAHCQGNHSERLVYEVLSSADNSTGEKLYLGIYESYGRSGGTERYERVLSNGTTFKLLRHLKGNLCHWFLQKGDQSYFRSKCSHPETAPPSGGWTSVAPVTQDDHIEVKAVVVKLEPFLARRLKIKNFVSSSPRFAVESSATGEMVADDESTALLSQMLHPAVGRALGETLHQRYASIDDRPVDSITIDGLFNDTLLAAALDFHKVATTPPPPHCHSQVPLSRWVGPEEATYCCAGKYRLSFDNWARKYCLFAHLAP